MHRSRSSPSALRSPLKCRPSGHGARSLIALSVTVGLLATFLACAPSSAHAPEGITVPTNPKVLAGFGSHPVNSEIASMWFASAPMPSSGVRLALMVYYRGPDGWLDQNVKYKADASADPAVADFRIGDIRIFLQFWPEKHLVKVFDQEISVAENNVVVVTGIGTERRPVVKAVSSFFDVVPDGENPSLFVLGASSPAYKALE